MTGEQPAATPTQPAERRPRPAATDPWRRRATILARAGRILATAPEADANLPEIARLVVPQLADWCVIDLFDHGDPSRVAGLSHANPRRQAALEERWRRYQAEARPPDGYAGVARTRKAIALRHLDTRRRARTAGNRAFLAALADLGAHAALVVPLVAHDRLLGVATLAMARPGRDFARDDLPTVQQLAGFCALAVDNARLLRVAQAELAEREEAGEALRESERFLTAALDALSAQIAVVDEGGTIIAANAAWHRFAEAGAYAGRDHGVGRNYLAICDTATGPGSEGAAEMAAGLREILQRRREFFAWAYPCHAPRQQRWFIARVTRFPGDGPVRAIIAHEEATEQYQAEAALRESEARFRTIFQQATDAILITDDAGCYVQTNPAARALLGVPDEAGLLGRWIGEFTPPEAREGVRSGWQRFLAAGQRTGLFTLQRPDGTTRIAEFQATARFQPGRHLSILRDVTNREQAAAERAAGRRELAAARETERLRLARELHDTAVQQLLGISFQLAAHGEAGGTASTLADIRRAVLDTVGHLRGVIRELRPAGLEEFGLTAALRGYLVALRRERGDALPAITIDLDHVGDDLPREAALCLFRVAQEALQNAIRHAEAREVRVTLFRDGDTVILSVRDDGRGFRVPERLTAYAQVGHFGLAGMSERVELAGGDFAIRSLPGRGTTMTARTPLAEGKGGDGGDGSDDEHAHPGAAGR